ncbi:MAG: aminoacyl-histidine dipeptidase [Firmicutes bacterium]|nr:aminoacyl-histidine dipeptidase [Bacillota bacterium]
MSDHVVNNLEPVEVFNYFQEISKIPRESGNEKAISDYLVAFATEHNLEVVQDDAFNVVIRKPGTAGYENSPGVVLQGHMDMVCEKDADIDHDFTKDPIILKVVDDMLYAEGTTLGADNGIAIAMGMAALTASDICHPPLELLVTTSEETGMDGAHALEAQLIKGAALLNMDSEEEGILTVSCAGGCTTKIDIPVSWETPNADLAVFTLSIEGLKGGHSGIEIAAGRANANKLLGRTLKSITTSLKTDLYTVEGGSKHNAIARSAYATIGVEKQDEQALKECLKTLENVFRNESMVTDPDICLQIIPAAPVSLKVLSQDSAKRVIQFLFLIPNGVQSMSMDIAGLVESSLNLAVIQTKEQSIEIISSMRSSVASLKENMLNIIKTLADISLGNVITEGMYPEWRYNPKSRLREVLIEQYTAMFGSQPIITAIHAGLECALFDEKFDGKMDMVSIGPTMFSVHTTQEHLSIPSTQRTWDYLKEVLKVLK